ncbi:MAG TPA: family 78 glycoside hydrolase catalytic domain [Steroidobacteraceae bacterium]|nr:family 78 glycoside hydrolase catalytic domain [Steroidobacteraceae bacterium]
MTSRRRLLKLLAAGASFGPALSRRVAAAANQRQNRGNGHGCDIRPQELRIEWRAGPIGLDTRRPRLTWTLAADPLLRAARQSACQVIIASSERAAKAGHGDIWDSGVLETPELRAAPDCDLDFKSQTPYWYAVRTWDGHGRASGYTQPARLVTGVIGPSDWRAAWISDGPDWPVSFAPPPAINRNPGVEPRRMPLFRRELRIEKPLARAIVSVCGLGQYELRINGERAGTGVLNPGWTNYRRTVLYDTLEVTPLLSQGANALAVMLGNGFFNVEKYPGRYTKLAGSFGRPKLILRLSLLFADGTEELVVSDGSWRTHPGPITLSSVYGGEDFDARLEPRGWDRPGLGTHGESGWAPALQVASPGGVLRAQSVPPVTVAHTYAPVRMTTPKAGVLVYDLGENFSGWPVIAVRGAAGRRVRLLPGELLDDRGLVTQRSANARPDDAVFFDYTLAGDCIERWRPRFSYYGFRYVQVEGAAAPGLGERGEGGEPAEPELLELRGEFLHDDLPSAGRLSAGNPLLDRIHGLILQALLSNTFSVLSDCPHREKLGWLEQTYLNADTVYYNEDAVTLYEKMMRDMMDGQLPDGMVPAIAPEYVAFLHADGADSAFRDSPEWGAAIVLSPWATYRYTGDRRILATGYPAMCRYADYLAMRAPQGLIDYGLGDWYDIGPRPPGESQLTSKALTAAATYCELLRTLSTIARLLGHRDDARRYSRRAVKSRNALNEHFFHPTANQYDSGSQTANAMPLAIGLVPRGHRAAVLENLVADIRAHGNHVTAGDVGFHYVVLALTRNGRGDVLYDILTRTDPPSYGYQLARGATSLTESWNADPDKSQNHFMLGHAETWLYGGLAGIQIDMSRPPSERIRIAPQAVDGIQAASARYPSVLGEVTVAWRKEGGHLYLEARIPPGAAATLEMPARMAGEVRESGKPLEQARGIGGIRQAGHAAVIIVGSGHYAFSAPET